LPQRGLGHAWGARRGEKVLEEALGVQLLVAEEFVSRPVKFVRAGTHHHDELSAGVIAVLGRIAPGQYPHFLHSFRRRRKGYGVDARFGGDHAVERGVLIHLPLAVGDDGDGLSRDGNAATATRKAVVAVPRAEHDAGIQNGEVAHVATA